MGGMGGPRGRADGAGPRGSGQGVRARGFGGEGPLVRVPTWHLARPVDAIPMMLITSGLFDVFAFFFGGSSPSKGTAMRLSCGFVGRWLGGLVCWRVGVLAGARGSAGWRVGGSACWYVGGLAGRRVGGSAGRAAAAAQSYARGDVVASVAQDAKLGHSRPSTAVRLRWRGRGGGGRGRAEGEVR